MCGRVVRSWAQAPQLLDTQCVAQRHSSSSEFDATLGCKPVAQAQLTSDFPLNTTSRFVIVLTMLIRLRTSWAACVVIAMYTRNCGSFIIRLCFLMFYIHSCHIIWSYIELNVIVIRHWCLIDISHLIKSIEAKMCCAGSYSAFLSSSFCGTQLPQRLYWSTVLFFKIGHNRFIFLLQMILSHLVIILITNYLVI